MNHDRWTNDTPIETHKPDRDLSASVRAAVGALNTATEAAVKAGLVADVSLLTTETVKGRFTIVSVRIMRPV